MFEFPPKSRRKFLSEQLRAGYELRAPDGDEKWLLIRLDWGSPISRYDSYEDAFYFWHEELRLARQEEVVLARMLTASRKCPKMRDACEQWAHERGRAVMPPPFTRISQEISHGRVGYGPKLVPRLAARAYRDDDGSVFSDLLSSLRDLDAKRMRAATRPAIMSSPGRRL